jgi:hypothetical protein
MTILPFTSQAAVDEVHDVIAIQGMPRVKIVGMTKCGHRDSYR